MPIGKKAPNLDNDNSTELPENQNTKNDDQTTAENPSPPALSPAPAQNQPPAPAQNQPLDPIDEDTSRANNTTKGSGSRSAGDGRIVVGRYYSDRDERYVSVQVDELIFFNAALTNDDVQLIYNSA